jgi:hypothetical protein
MSRRSVAWTPRRELAHRLPGLIRCAVRYVRLVPRVAFAITLGDRDYFNRTLDAVTCREAADSPDPRVVALGLALVAHQGGGSCQA